jgi:hypothetical protein
MGRADLGTDQYLNSTSVTETFEASSFNALCPYHARGPILLSGQVSFNILLSNCPFHSYWLVHSLLDLS